jgi:hypothetical protein
MIAAMLMLRTPAREGHVRPAEGSKTANCRAEDEADAERRAEHAEQSGSLLLWRDVGDRGLGHEQAAARCPIHDPAEEQHPQRTCSAGDEAADRRTDQPDDDDRLATDPIRQPAEQRRTHQLGERVGGEQQTNGEAGCAEPFGIPAEDRHDDPEADEIERDRGPDRPVALRHRGALTPRHDLLFYLVGVSLPSERYSNRPFDQPRADVGGRASHRAGSSCPAPPGDVAGPNQVDS